MKAIQNWFVKDRVQAIKGEVAKDEVSNFLILAENDLILSEHDEKCDCNDLGSQIREVKDKQKEINKQLGLLAEHVDTNTKHITNTIDSNTGHGALNGDSPNVSKGDIGGDSVGDLHMDSTSSYGQFENQAAGVLSNELDEIHNSLGSMAMSLLTLQNQLTEFKTLSNGQQGELDDIKKNISDIQETLEHFEDLRPALDLQNDQIHSLSSQIDNFNETITQVATDVATYVATEVATNIATDIATGIATDIASEVTVVNKNVTNVDEMTRELLKKEIYSEVLAQIQSDLPAMVEKERKKNHNDLENVSHHKNRT